MRRALPLAGLLLLAAAASGQAQGAACNPAEATLTFQPGQGCHQATHDLRKGDAIAYAWQVTDPSNGTLDFSTHIHIGAQLVNITAGTYHGQDGRLVADRDGLYSMLWVNNGNDTVTYHYTYRLQYAQATKTPLEPALALLALAGGAAWRRR